MKTIVLLLCLVSTYVAADCPLDHLLIGRNADGINGTDDDYQLFVDCTQKYRHSDPNNNSSPTWRYRHYPLYYSPMFKRYQIGEPGFDLIADDPNRKLEGIANVDYKLIIECVSIQQGLSAVSGSIILDQPGDWFCHSDLPETHVHFQYRVPRPANGSSLNEMYWITFQVSDAVQDGNRYVSSDPVTIVFVQDPLDGDLVVDGTVDGLDLMELGRFWLSQDANRINDYYEWADSDQDGIVNLKDFKMLAGNWLVTQI